MKKTLLYFASVTIWLGVSACGRFLDEKSDSLLGIPETLEDNQAILDRYFVTGLNANSPEISADDIYIVESDFNAMPYESEKRLHLWQPDYVSLESGSDWENSYTKINIFNTVLFNLQHYEIPNSGNVRGQALVFRAATYLEAAICCSGNNDTAVWRSERM